MASEGTSTMETTEKAQLETSVVALSNDSSEPHVLEASDLNDALDPQNWTAWRKRMVFLALMSSSILCDG